VENPVLANIKKFRYATTDEVATRAGAAVKTFALLAVVVMCAGGTWIWAASQASMPYGVMLGSAIGAFILGIIGVNSPERCEFIAPGYAVFEGITLGIWSLYFETLYPGIIGLAVFSTFGVLGTMLFLWGANIIKVTDKFVSTIKVAMLSICFLYILDIILSMFGVPLPFLQIGGPGSIVISAIVVLVASFNLLIDFDVIDKTTKNGSPKYYEWYGALGLMISLIWLYMEIVRLIANLSSSDD
jgi:uncharacterized YccA/Bax inhibitor family protein